METKTPVRVPLAAQGLRFVATGAANTVLTLVLYQALVSVAPYTVAYTLSFGAGVVFSAAVNSRLVFSSRLTWATATRYAAVYLGLYFLGLYVTIALVEFVRLPARIAPVGTVLLLLPISFLMSRLALTHPSPRR